MHHIAAIVGFTLCLLVVQLGSRIGNPVARYAAMIAGVLAGLAVAAGPSDAVIRAGACVAGVVMGCALAFVDDEPTG